MQIVKRLRPAATRVISLTIISLVVATMVLSTALLPGAKPALAAAQVVSIQRVSVPGTEGDHAAQYPSISADGRYVAFQSAASNLVASDNNGWEDIFVHDRQTGETTRVSVASDGTQGDLRSIFPSISADGRYVAFESYATTLVAGDSNGATDIFVHDRDTGETVRVSLTYDNAEGNGYSYSPIISADGHHVAFSSTASNMVLVDNNGKDDIFVRGLVTGETTRLSVSSGGAEVNGASSEPSISADGRYVAFYSSATNLVAGDTSIRPDIFVHDRQTGQTTRVSVASDGTEGDGASFGPSITADGRHVAFGSWASNLVSGDANGIYDVFVHDRQTAETTRASVSSGGTEGNNGSSNDGISADGRYVVFESAANNLVADDTNGVSDVFVHDRQTGETTRVSVTSSGSEGDGDSTYASISADGRCVAFVSRATNLVGGDTNGFDDIFVHDRQTEDTTRVSLGWDGAEGNNDSWYPCMSADGRYVAFFSGASTLVADDNNSMWDVFVSDRQTGETIRVSVASDGTEGNGSSTFASISADGRYVAFQSNARNLVAGDSNLRADVFVHDRQTGATTRVSVASDNTEGNYESFDTSISADGRYVAFYSFATNLVASDNNGAPDVFVHDRQTGATTRVSVASDNTEGNYESFYPSISADGRHVAFQSWATNLVDGDTNGYPDVFVRDLQEGETTRVSVDSEGSQGNNDSYLPSISADGQYVAFTSVASNLVSNDTNGAWDIFVHDRQTGETTRVNVASDGSEGDGGGSACASISANGRYVAFYSDATNLVASDTNSWSDVFVHDRQTGVTTRVSVAVDGIQGDNYSLEASISGDGLHIAFHSDATNLVADDTNGYMDTFVVSWQNPALAYTPTSIDFGVQYQDSTANQTLQVQNTGTGILSFNLSENSAWCSVTPDAGDSSGETDDISVVVDTSGLSPGSYSCVILIASDGGLGIVPVHVLVQAKPVIDVAPASHDFGTVAIGGTLEQVITVSNSGTADLVIGTVASANPLAAPFSIASNSYSGPLAPGDNCTLTVRFSPTVDGTFSDSFDIPSNDPNTPSVTVALTGATPNTAPTAPVVAITPDSPGTTADLVCSITTQSSDAHGDAITYTYQWYKDGVAQSALTTNTVAAANTAKGQVWKCVVIPYDGTVDGPSAEDAVTIGNTAPTAPVVAVTPDSPDTTADLVCSITTQSTDADGDTITYSYQWYKDDVLQSSLITSAVPAAETAKGQVWKCVVTPGDGTASGSAAEDQVTIQNSAPAAPVVAITPDSPGSGADLVCSISTQSADADGDAITYTYQWYKDGVLQSALTTNTVGAAETAKDEVWKCVVTPSDGTASGPSAEDEVTVTGSAGGFPAGAIAGIVIGVLVLAAAAAFLWFRFLKKPK